LVFGQILGKKPNFLFLVFRHRTDGHLGTKKRLFKDGRTDEIPYIYISVRLSVYIGVDRWIFMQRKIEIGKSVEKTTKITNFKPHQNHP